MSEAEHETHPVSPWRLGLEAARRNAVPGVCLAVFAVALGLSYAFVPAFTQRFDAFAAWRQSLVFPLDWAFPIASTAVFGGGVPWLVQRLRPGGVVNAPFRDLAYWLAFWGFKGFEINLLYLGLAALVGDSDALPVVLGKIALDMGVYCPLWAMPTTLLAYQYREVGYRWRRLCSGPLGHGVATWYRWDVLPVAVNNWAVWIPAVAVIYTMPLALQLPIQNLVLCFWSLVLLFMTTGLEVRRSREPASPG